MRPLSHEFEPGTADECTKDWHSMNTKLAEQGPKQEAAGTTSGDASQGLIEGKQTKQAVVDEGDIYSSHHSGDNDDDDDEDEFLDHPMWESRGTVAEQSLVRLLRVLEKMYK